MNQEIELLFLRDALWSAIAAVGFAILFNVPRQTLLSCAFGGALGHAIRTGLMMWGWPLEAATLVGATALGFWGEWAARHYRIPRLIFILPGAIPLVPGVLAYRTMIGIFEVTELANLMPEEGSDVLLNVAVNAIRTGLVLAAIAIGIVAPNLLFQRKKTIF